MDFIKGLNDKQKEAVYYGDGPLLILAGAGSGKTRVLTHRIAYLIEERGVFPGNILAITFTNKAANEMKGRVGKLLHGKAEDVWMGTFHSICVRILRMFINRLGYDRNFIIYDTDDQKTLVKECIKEKNLNKDTYKEKSIISIISSQKNLMLTPDAYINENYGDFYCRNVGEIYAFYQEKLKKNNALDFDDLILKTIELLKKDKDALEYCQKKFKYIFVDEYQDTNKAQYVLIRLLSGKYKNVCVVGDDDQSIYGWRGADIRNILDFEKDFPNTKIIKLEQNYRSTKNILDVANSIIKNNRERKDKKLWTTNGEGTPTTIYTAFDEMDEGNFVADKIRSLVDTGEYNLSDFAILYRTNAQSRAFEEVFMRKDIPYRIVGGLKFYARKEVKDIIAYLRLIQNPADDVSLRRIINIPKRGIGLSTIAKIEKYIAQTGESIYSALLDVEDIPGLSQRAITNLKSFTEMINKFIAMKEVMELKDFIEEVVYSTGYIKELEEEDNIESTSRIENIKEFISVAVDYETHSEEATLEDFLATVSLLSDVDKTEKNGDTVTLMTVHSAKGLEYPVVFVVGMEEGLFPIRRALDGGSDELEEERRLCYVAVTRAQKLLYITFATVRTIYGNTSYSIPSSFLKEIPEELVIRDDKKRKFTAEPKEQKWRSKAQGVVVKEYKKGNTVLKKMLENRNVERDKKNKFIENKSKIKIGSKVKHKMWGIGTVVQLKEKEGDMEILVAFPEKGLKKLLLSVAPVEVI
mgnify:CR=1 FL=1